MDAEHFERLVDDGRRALDDGSAAEAAQMLEEALGLWRGRALEEFAFDDFARDEIHRLEELRQRATEDRIESLLRLGRHAEIVGRLASLVAAHPLRERLRGQWMLALYRSGRQAEALEAYRDGRRLLASELGLEPGPELHRLERAILAQDPELEAPAPAAPRPRAVGPDEQHPPRSRLGSRRGRIVVGSVLLAVALATLVLVVAFARDQPPTAVVVTAPAVVAIDARTNRVVASIPAGSKPASVASGDGAIWVGDAQDGTVTRIDPVSRRVVKTIGIGAPAIGLATGAGNVWVATGGFGMVVRIDSRLGAVTRRIELGNPDNPVVPTVSAVGFAEGRLWAGAFDGLVRIDPDSGEIMRRVDLDQNPALDIAVGGDAVWAALFSNRAKRVDASSAQVTAEFYTGAFSFAIALDRSAVWLAGADRGQLWKFDPVRGSTLLTSRAGHGSTAVALGSGAVWVASWTDRAIVRVDPATGDVLATIPVGGEPHDVVARDGLVWAAVQPAPTN